MAARCCNTAGRQADTHIRQHQPVAADSVKAQRRPPIRYQRLQAQQRTLSKGSCSSSGLMVYLVCPPLFTSTISSASFRRGCNRDASRTQYARASGCTANPQAPPASAALRSAAANTPPSACTFARPLPLIACRIGAGRTAFGCADDAISDAQTGSWRSAGPGRCTDRHKQPSLHHELRHSAALPSAIGRTAPRPADSCTHQTSRV